jgi:hypothetical protein
MSPSWNTNRNNIGLKMTLSQIIHMSAARIFPERRQPVLCVCVRVRVCVCVGWGGESTRRFACKLLFKPFKIIFTDGARLFSIE